MPTPLQQKCTRRWMSLIHQPPTIFITATKLLGEADRQGGLDESKQRHHVLFSHIAPCQQCNLYGYLLSRMHEKCKSIPHDSARHLHFGKRMAHSRGTEEPGRIQLLVFAPTDAPAASNCCIELLRPSGHSTCLIWPKSTSTFSSKTARPGFAYSVWGWCSRHPLVHLSRLPSVIPSSTPSLCNYHPT